MNTRIFIDFYFTILLVVFPCSGIMYLLLHVCINGQTAMHFMQSTAMAEFIVSHKAVEK